MRCQGWEGFRQCGENPNPVITSQGPLGLLELRPGTRRKQALTVGARGTRLILDDSGQQVTVEHKMLL